MRLLSVLLAVALLAQFQMTQPAIALGPADCASQVVPDVVRYASTETEKLAALDLISEDDYNKSGLAGQLQAILPNEGLPVPVGANYTQLKEFLRRLKNQHNYSLDSSHSVALVTQTMTNNNLTAYLACLQASGSGPDVSGVIENGTRTNDGTAFREVYLLVTFKPGPSVPETMVNLNIGSGGTLETSSIKLVGNQRRVVRIARTGSQPDSIVTLQPEFGNGSAVYIQWIIPEPIAPPPRPPVQFLATLPEKERDNSAQTPSPALPADMNLTIRWIPPAPGISDCPYVTVKEPDVTAYELRVQSDTNQLTVFLKKGTVITSHACEIWEPNHVYTGAPQVTLSGTYRP
jgi:hypothetical protein